MLRELHGIDVRVFLLVVALFYGITVICLSRLLLRLFIAFFLRLRRLHFLHQSAAFGIQVVAFTDKACFLKDVTALMGFICLFLQVGHLLVNLGYSVCRADSFCFTGGHALILRKRLGLAMAAVYPLLKVLQVCGGHDDFPLVRPVIAVIGEVSVPCVVLIIEAEHYLVLVKRAVLVILVNNVHPASVPSVYVVSQEHVDMVAVHALCTTDVTVGVLHGSFPRIAVCIRAATHTSFRVLDCDVELTDAHMAFLVVPGFFLCFCWVLFGFRLCLCNFRGKSITVVYVIDNLGNVAKPFVVELEIGAGIMSVLVRLIYLRGSVCTVNDDTPLIGRPFAVSLLPVIVIYLHTRGQICFSSLYFFLPDTAFSSSIIGGNPCSALSSSS